LELSSLASFNDRWNDHRRMEISGSEVRALGDDQRTHEGGRLALPTNIGCYRSSDFAALPELGFHLSLAVTDHLRVNAGYSLVVLTGVARSGAQIDRNINSSQLSGGNLIGQPRPQPVLADDAGFWVQGVNVGVVFER
jgi:hypothetical protein